MKFVALISGGKDSCFNILHCLANGHELVCLANLFPPPSDSDELDSFMYQTVGHDIISYYAKCTGKPLYRQQINGTSANQKLEYKKTTNDETEDLFQLLSTVLKHHPDVEGVSVGAILSSYQRTRVEDVCLRLGLTSLSYLWQRDQTELMSEMCDSGMEAILIKVAAIGLNAKHLGLTLQNAFPVLLNLNQRFGVHVCGEGGEFETLVLDAPFFTKGKLIVKEQQIVKHTNDDVWYLKLKVEFVPKNDSGDQILDWSQFLSTPPLLNERFQEISDSLPKINQDEKPKEKALTTNTNTQLWKFNSTTVDNKLYVANITSNEEQLEAQIQDIFSQLSSELKKRDFKFANIQTSSLLVKDMSNFATINKIYCKYFTEPLPPSRVCVESNILPPGVLAQLSVTVIDDLQFKQGLHVQGRSYWAPSNIGPYSQAIIDRRDNIALLNKF
ncbi:unnamed protein product [Ambrosiozyma monospora]|uniref:Diphthine--ammonia ligase n=1 Tax=Ambrosiozyma monospora TaxID=43982 RepID=A0A9W6Z1H3_AMBMO|nr:unnamed protein product [Ambrosiozyma monospora]